MPPSHDILFAVDHPTAAGHFPDNPVIPGAVLLDEVLRAIAPDAAACDIRSAKFLHPVRPGERLTIHWQATPGGEVKFDCFLPDPERLALTGTLSAGGAP